MGRAWIVRLRGRLMATRPGRLALTPGEDRDIALTTAGAAFGYAYAVFCFAAGVMARDAFTGSYGVYILALTVARTYLVRGRRSDEGKDTAAALALGWRRYRNVGWWLLAVNITMSSIVFQAAFREGAFNYPGFSIFAYAAYAFYSVASAGVGLARKRASISPYSKGIQALSACNAMMTLLSLQTALLGRYSGEATFAFVMDVALGTFICATTVAIAVDAIIKARRAIRNT